MRITVRGTAKIIGTGMTRITVKGALTVMYIYIYNYIHIINRLLCNVNNKYMNAPLHTSFS